MKYKIGFICVHNSCRSQMAEGMMRALGSDYFEVYSAGTENYHEVKPLAIEVMKDIGIDISSHYPKLLDAIPSELDFLITMGCNVQCPFVANKYMEDWGLDDPSGSTIKAFEQTRDIIKEKCLSLIKKVEAGSFSFE